MSASTTLPITIRSDAIERIEELGMQPEFEQILEHARLSVSYLRSIRVTIEPDAEGELDSQVVLWLHREAGNWDMDQSETELSRWKVTTFPPEVCVHFVM